MELENDVTATSWEHLQELLFKNTWDECLMRYRSPYVYRGLGDVKFTLETSLMRLGGDFSTLESHLLRNFRKYAHKNAVAGDSVWNWLAVAQHHGLPTRLVDWTYSPYVALHFATSDLNLINRDGIIWCINYVKTNSHLPLKLANKLEEEGGNVFTPSILDQVCSSLKELDHFQDDPFVIFLEPPSLDERIVNQHALFSLMANSKTLLDKWLKKNEGHAFRIIIPAEIKWEVRDKLDQANITERVLFPGLDGLSTWLKRHYSPKT